MCDDYSVLGIMNNVQGTMGCVWRVMVMAYVVWLMMVSLWFRRSAMYDYDERCLVYGVWQIIYLFMYVGYYV